MKLKYGVNPHQKFIGVEAVENSDAGGKSGAPLPVQLLNGQTSYINWLDALNAWQLVREAKLACGLPAAASFKHVSPAGAALAVPLSPQLAAAYEVRDAAALPPAALAYVRARGADPKCSFGDFAAISEPVCLETARVLRGVVSDGIIAPGYAPDALEILRAKKKGAFIVMQADPEYSPPRTEAREIFGMRFTQERNRHLVSAADFQEIVGGELTAEARRNLLLGLVTLKYTQSNSVGFAHGGQMIGIGAGQQSRVDCTKLAGAKAAAWFLRTHPKVLALRFAKGVSRQQRINWRVRFIEGDFTAGEGAAFAAATERESAPLTNDERAQWLAAQQRDVAMVSDAFIPFRDNIDHARKYGVRFVAEHGGSVRRDEIAAACGEYGMVLVRTGLRLFHH